MARVRKRGSGWAVELRRNGVTEHATFGTKAEAAAWALQREAEITGKRLPDKTLADALIRYRDEIPAPTPAAARWRRNKLANLLAYPIARKRLVALSRADFAAWRDARLSGPRLKGKGAVKGSTVNRELNLLSAVLGQCCGDWEWLRANPMAGLSRPPEPKGRRRRITDAEALAVCKGLGYTSGPPETKSQRVALAFLFAIETAMRGGEIVRLQRSHVGKLSVHIPKSKNGDARDVPLSTRAREILALVNGDFGLTDAQRGALFREGRNLAGIRNLHFHDSRAEAIWRLSKKLDVLELARVIGHRNINSLLFYYETSADELAAKLA